MITTSFLVDNFGNILTLIIVVSGFVALYLQAKSLKVSEKELQIKVKEISDLVYKIEHEKQARKSLEGSHNSLSAKQKKDYLSNLNYLNDAYDTLLDISRGSLQIQRERMETLSSSISLLSVLIRDRESIPEKTHNNLLKKISSSNINLCKMLIYERGFSDEEEVKIQKIKTKYEKKQEMNKINENEELNISVIERNILIEKTIEDGNILFNKNIDNLSKEYRNSVLEMHALFEDLTNFKLAGLNKSS